MKKKRRIPSRVLSFGMATMMAASLTTVAAAADAPSGVKIADQVVSAPECVITDTEAKNVVIKSTYEGFNPIIVRDSDYTIDGANITIDSDGDGSVACDFSGYGAAIAAYGKSNLKIKNSDVNVSGVGNLALFADNGANVYIEHSKFFSAGGTLYEGYRNSPDQATMVAPPWILGIMGTSRTTNLMGNDSSTTVVDSDMSSSQWAVLSTDSGSNMKLNVVNTTMTLKGMGDKALQADGTFSAKNPYTSRSGYGTYTIGQAHEYFYGVDMHVGTYANIMTGGYATYAAMKAGESIPLYDALGNKITDYVPSTSKATTIDSDTFGFMVHQNSGLPANELTITEGTQVNSGYTSILHKTGSSVKAVISDGAQLNPGNGILIQAMDNDDATTGMDMATFSFITKHVENAGWPTEGATAAGSETGSYTFDDVDLTGDIFNATGWNVNDSGAQSPIAMSIDLTNGSSLTGQISSTAAIHVTKAGSDAVKAAASGAKASDSWTEYQNTEFPIGHYFDIGQVANRIQSNTYNTIDVTVEDGSVWNVTGDGILNNIDLAQATSISADKPVTLRLSGDLTIAGEKVDLTAAPEEDADAAEQSEDAAEAAEGVTIGNVTFVVDDSVATQPDPDAGEGGEGGPGGPGGGPGMGGDQGDETWYQPEDKLTLSVKDGVVVAPKTEGATNYTVDRLMYGTADNLSSFSGGGHDKDGDDDYAYLTAIYVKDGKLVDQIGVPESTEPAPDPTPDTKPDPAPAPDPAPTPDTNKPAQTVTDTKKDQTKTDGTKTSTTTTTAKKSPKTGDSSMPLLVGSIGIAALAALIVLFIVKKRTGRQNN